MFCFLFSELKSIFGSIEFCWVSRLCMHFSGVSFVFSRFSRFLEFLDFREFCEISRKFIMWNKEISSFTKIYEAKIFWIIKICICEKVSSTNFYLFIYFYFLFYFIFDLWPLPCNGIISLYSVTNIWVYFSSIKL